MQLLPATAIIILLGGDRHSAVAFAPPSPIACGPSSSSFISSRGGNTRRRRASESFSSCINELRSRLPDDDDDVYIDEDDDDDDEEEDGLDALAGKKLGINIDLSLSPEEIADIKAEAQTYLDAAVDSRLADIEELRTELQDELAESRSRMETAAKLNVQFEKQNLMEKIDRLSNDFLNKDADFRVSTKRIADADKASTGRGVDWGSWGNLGDGEVVVSGASDEGAGGQSKLLGSVDAARRRGQLLADAADGEDEIDESVSAIAAAAAENRVLVLVDDKKVRDLQISKHYNTSCRALFAHSVISFAPTGQGGNTNPKSTHRPTQRCL